MEPIRFITKAREFFLCIGRIFFPEYCVLCGTELLFRVNWQFPVCASCKDKIAPLAGQKRCRICSVPLISEMGICTRCRTRKYHFQSHYALFEYSGLVKELIYQYKFKYKKHLSHLWAEYMGDMIAGNYKHKTVVPVPAGYKGKKKRGWDHLEVIADIIRRKYGIKVSRCLTRDKSREQKALDYDMRITNIQGKIHCKRPGDIRGSAILLLDDVFTTGATVSECARVLLEAGAESVDVLTLAID